MSAPLRLIIDGDALVANWRWLDRQSGAAACGAAVKADGYGVGARGVVDRLAAAGCRDFFVATWAEAQALAPLPPGVSLSVLHGVRAQDMAVATKSAARPVINTRDQAARWRTTGQPCDVMIDTGMNRLGLSGDDLASGVLTGLTIETLMSHLASADEDSAMNAAQRLAFATLAGRAGAKRLSLANSAGVCLGPDYAFDLTRPGLALYGGIPRLEARGHISPVVSIEAQILARRRVGPGESVGYNATWHATRPSEIAIVNLGYADGYGRCFSGPDDRRGGSASAGRFPVVGRVSMDLTALRVDADPALREGDWLTIDYDLAAAADQTGRSQYELLTGLGARFERIWRRTGAA